MLRAGSMSLIQSATRQWIWGFHILRGGIEPGELRFRPRSCRGMEGVLILGWDLILSGCGGISTLARGAALAARWLYEP